MKRLPNLYWILLIAGMISWYLYEKKKQRALIRTDQFPLKAGDRGREVKQLQRYLLDKYPVVPEFQVSGVFDSMTQKALQDHTSRQKLNLTAYVKWEIYTY